jgi:hypothetical protein
VNVTDNVWPPAGRTVPAAGEYANVPGTDAVAFNCAAPRAVPYVRLFGAVHEMLVAAFVTERVTSAVAPE